MDVLIMMLLGAAVRFEHNGNEIMIHDGVIYANKKAVGTLDLEPFDRRMLEASEPEMAGRKYVVTYQVDGRKALRSFGATESEAQDAEIPRWMDGQLRLGEAWVTPNGDYLIWQPTGADAMRIWTGDVEVCRCTDNTVPQGQCDPNDCNGDCGRGGPGNVCKWVRSSGGGCTVPAAMIVPMMLGCFFIRRLR